MKKIAFFLIIMHFSFSNVLAQTIAVSARTNAFAFLTGGTPMYKDSVWDEPQTDYKLSLILIKIPFQFGFGKFMSDSVIVGDGEMYLFKGDSVLEFGIASDLVDRGIGTKRPRSPVSWQVQGVAPSRILKIQWKNFGFYGQVNAGKSTTDSGNSQIWLYEGGNKMELHFGKSSVKDTNSYLGEKGALVFLEHYSLKDSNGVYKYIITGTASAPVLGNIKTDPSFTGMPADGSVIVVQYIPKTSAVWSANGAEKNVFYVFEKTLYTTETKGRAYIYDINGKCVFIVSIEAGMADLSGLHTGNYFVKVNGNMLKIILD